MLPLLLPVPALLLLLLPLLLVQNTTAATGEGAVIPAVAVSTAADAATAGFSAADTSVSALLLSLLQQQRPNCLGHCVC